eukprot:gene13835-29430_t
MASLLLAFILLSIICLGYGVINDLSELPYDKNGHLISHWLLVPGGPCGDKITRTWDVVDHSLREIAQVSDEVASNLFGYDGSSCKAICLERGVPLLSVNHPIPEKIYDESLGSFSRWFSETCQSIEMGFISYHPNPIIVYWISADGSRKKIHDLQSGEYHTFWFNTVLGHAFDLVDSVNGTSMGEYRAQYNGFHPIGDAGSMVGKSVGNEEQGVKHLFQSEFIRSRRVKRTFTEFGFNKGRLPDDVWGS